MTRKYNQYDIRVRKTRKMLFETLTIHLTQKKFKSITVNDICKKSSMSRATFYEHFSDKYDLLRWWLMIWKPKIKLVRYDYVEFDKTINQFVDDNRKIITNLLEDANSETIDLLVEFVSSLLSDFIGNDGAADSNQFDTVLYCFCAGGIISLVSWQVKNSFPINLKMVNEHFYEILDAIRRLKHANAAGDTTDDDMAE